MKVLVDFRVAESKATVRDIAHLLAVLDSAGFHSSPMRGSFVGMATVFTVEITDEEKGEATK